MKKPIRTNVKFKDYSPDQTLLLPPSLDEMIEANHPVRIVNRVIDQIEIDPKKVADTITKINEALKDKPVSKKVTQKLKFAAKNWPVNLEKYDQQEKILQGRNS